MMRRLSRTHQITRKLWNWFLIVAFHWSFWGGRIWVNRGCPKVSKNSTRPHLFSQSIWPRHTRMKSKQWSVTRNKKKSHSWPYSFVPHRLSFFFLEKRKNSHAESQQEGLREEEIYDNIFMFNFAGHDANNQFFSVGYCISLLTTRPNTQDWIADEINFVLTGWDSEESSYEAEFSQLKCCLTVIVSIL